MLHPGTVFRLKAGAKRTITSDVLGLLSLTSSGLNVQVTLHARPCVLRSIKMFLPGGMPRTPSWTLVYAYAQADRFSGDDL